MFAVKQFDKVLGCRKNTNVEIVWGVKYRLKFGIIL